MTKRLLIAVLLTLCLAPLVRAQTAVYYYVDEDGAYHFNNIKLPGYRLYRPVSRYAPPSQKAAPLRPSVPPEERRKILDLIDKIAEEEGMDADLVRAVARAESNFDPWAVSEDGARGVMQLLPETAEDYGTRNLLDPEQNLRTGVRYLRDMLIRFDGHLDLTLAAYNAGPGAVVEHGGVPPFRETRDYIENVTRFYWEYKGKPAVVGFP